MLQLPDGNILDMRWKTVSYVMDNKRIVFAIEPMIDGPDVVCIPTKEKCIGKLDISIRNEFIFLLQTADWRRDLKLIEMNISPQIVDINKKNIVEGSIESTEGGKKLESLYLFNPNSPLSKEQVRELYIKLETRFADNVSGQVKILKDGVLKGSVMDKITIPTLEKNKKAKIEYI